MMTPYKPEQGTDLLEEKLRVYYTNERGPVLPEYGSRFPELVHRTLSEQVAHSHQPSFACIVNGKEVTFNLDAITFAGVARAAFPDNADSASACTYLLPNGTCGLLDKQFLELEEGIVFNIIGTP